MCTASGGFLVAAALLRGIPWVSVTALVLSRLALGVGESLGSTGANTAVGDHGGGAVAYHHKSHLK